MKKIVGVLILLVVIFSLNKNVYAEESIYYTTTNGIELTEEEYHFLTEFYWDGYPDIMTEEQYERVDYIDYCGIRFIHWFLNK